MANHFIKVTSTVLGTPIYINGDYVTAVYSDFLGGDEDNTIIRTNGDRDNYRVEESVETVANLLCGAMQE